MKSFRRVVVGSLALVSLSLFLFDGIIFRLSTFSSQGRINVKTNDTSLSFADYQYSTAEASIQSILVRSIRNETASTTSTTMQMIPIHMHKHPVTETTTIVVQLSGEMGNNLSKLAHGFGLSLWLKRHYNMDSSIVLRHQEHRKWVHGQQALTKCFPFTRSYDFRAANTPEFTQLDDIQKEWIKPLMDGINSPGQAKVSKALQNFVKLNRTRNGLARQNGNNGTISSPFLYANWLVMHDTFMDQFYDDYRQLFRFDPSCCKVLPDPDESVFHFRNFVHEMPRRGRRKGYAELSPNQTARDLFGHLESGDKVAITTRFDTNATLPYVEALERRGLQVRVITNQTGTQDFCFLMNAQKELVGLTRSTFFLWAGFLGNSSRVRAYSIDSPDRRKAGIALFDHYNWTNPVLQSRVFFELYKVDPLER